MTTHNYEYIDSNGAPIKAWTKGVQFDPNAQQQLKNVAELPFVFKHLAVMPDVHGGKGATIGCVLPTLGAIIPAAVGVDIGCGMMAVKTSLMAGQLPDDLAELRSNIEAAVPHGRARRFTGAANDPGSWTQIPPDVEAAWPSLSDPFRWRPAIDGTVRKLLCTSRLEDLT